MSDTNIQAVNRDTPAARTIREAVAEVVGAHALPDLLAADYAEDGAMALWDEAARRAFGLHYVEVVRVVRTSRGLRLVGNAAEPGDGFVHAFRLDCDLGDDGERSYAAQSESDGRDMAGAAAAAAGATVAQAMHGTAKYWHHLGMGGADCRSLLGTPAGAWLTEGA